ncbi:MAG: hypothetical protein WCA19_03490 [Candidatus Acidiferrales bacterium]
MQKTINAGTVLFRDGTIFPETFKCESEAYSPGWRSVKGLDGFELDGKMQNAGWHFFYFAGENKVTVSGREGEETMGKAIKRIQASLKFEKSNSFEITRVALKTFLGVPYTSVSFHLRNIQESMQLLGDETVQPWKDARFVAA